MSLIIFSGFNSRAVIAFCRYATKNSIPVYIIANGNDDNIFDTQFKEWVFATRQKNYLSVETIIEYCNQIKSVSGNNKVLILPTTEYLNRFLIDNQNEFLRNDIYTGLCNESIYEKISDKHSFSYLCSKHDINIPLEHDKKPDKYPFVIKSKKYGEGLENLHDKPALIQNEKDFDQYIDGKDLNNYFFQEYIDGQSYYLLYYIFKNGNYSVYSQKNLMQQSHGGSMILCESADIHKQDIAKQYAELFSRIEFSGIVMVEIKLYNGKYYMIEANPRLWGPSQLILDSGMDLFDCFVYENGLTNNQPERKYTAGKYYFWSGGLKKTLSDGFSPKFYDFNPQSFIEKYNQIQSSEIYLKEDTLKIYLKENNNE